MSNLEHALEAGEAEAGLYIMGAVVALLEGGVCPGGSAGISRTARRIIDLCAREQQRQLRRMDKHRAKIKEFA